MNHLKRLGLMAIVGAAFMAFAASASAVELTSPTGSSYEGSITAYNEPDTEVILRGSFGVEVPCQSHVTGEIAEQTANHVAGPITSLSFTECTDNEVTVIDNGTLTIDGAGTVTSDGTTVLIHTSVGIQCEYTTNNTDIGRLTDSHETSSTATFDIDAEIPRTGGSFLCGKLGVWEGAYLVEAEEGVTDLLYLDE